MGDPPPGVTAVMAPPLSSRDPPDGRTVVVADSFAGTLIAFDIGPDGSLTGRRLWAEGLSLDGITIDDEGAVWTSTRGTRSAAPPPAAS